MSASVLGLTPYRQAKIDILLRLHAALIPLYYRPDCCIASTRILCEVLRHYHVAARAMSVYAVVSSPGYLQQQKETGKEVPDDHEEALVWAQKGGWLVIMGDTDEPAQPGKWPGHLCCVAWEDVLIDGALVQASRPEKGIKLANLAAKMPPLFVEGELTGRVTINGSEVEYQTRPRDRSFEVAKDWWDVRRHKPVISRIISCMNRELAQLG